MHIFNTPESYINYLNNTAALDHIDRIGTPPNGISATGVVEFYQALARHQITKFETYSFIWDIYQAIWADTMEAQEIIAKVDLYNLSNLKKNQNPPNPEKLLTIDNFWASNTLAWPYIIISEPLAPILFWTGIHFKENICLWCFFEKVSENNTTTNLSQTVCLDPAYWEQTTKPEHKIYSQPKLDIALRNKNIDLTCLITAAKIAIKQIVEFSRTQKY